MAWHSADHIAPKEGSFEPVRAYDYTVMFSKLKDIDLHVRTANLPTITNEPIEIPYMNETRKVAGKIAIEAGELTVGDFVDPDTAKLIEEWRGLVSDVKMGYVYNATTYKDDGELYLYQGNGTLIRTWKLIGCWPSNVNFGSLDYSSSDQVQITMTIQYDKAYML
jgi:hypothetical protein